MTNTTARHLLLAGLLCALPLAEASPRPRHNDLVLEVARSFEDGGGYDRSWSGSGTPVEITHDGTRILRASTSGSYCCGYTFAVVMAAAAEAGLLEGKTAAEVRRFQREWYGAVDDPTLREQQCSLAVENLGIGRQVRARDARPGDFLQLWRQTSGHSVIFLGWVTDAGSRDPVGIRYRSSQGSTDGIGDSEERFEGHGGHVDPERIYFGRLD
jgi:hypothetical protein